MRSCAVVSIKSVHLAADLVSHEIGIDSFVPQKEVCIHVTNGESPMLSCAITCTLPALSLQIDESHKLHLSDNGI